MSKSVFGLIIILFFAISCTQETQKKALINTEQSDTLEKISSNLRSKKQLYEDYDTCERNTLLLDSLLLAHKLDTFYHSAMGGQDYILVGSVFNPIKTHCVSLCDYHFEDSLNHIFAFKLNIWYKKKQNWIKVLEQDTLKFTYGTNPFYGSNDTFIKYEDVNKDGYKDLMIIQGISAIHPTKWWYLWLYNSQSNSLDFIKGFETLDILDYCYLDNKLTIFHKNTNWGVFSLKQISFLKGNLIMEKEYKWQINKENKGSFIYKEFGKEVNTISDFSYKSFEKLVLKDKSLCIKDRWF